MELRGLAAAPGIAIGPVWRYRHGDVIATPLPDVRAAADRAASELLALAERVRGLGRGDEAEIFDAQALMAVDPMLLDEAQARARAIGTADPDALAAAVEAVARAAAETWPRCRTRLAARAADVRDVGSRIARTWPAARSTCPTGPRSPSPTTCHRRSPPSCHRLAPGDRLEAGSPLSHASILARAWASRPSSRSGAGGRGRRRRRGDRRGDLMAGLDGDAGTIILGHRPRRSPASTPAACNGARGRVAPPRRPGGTADGVAVPLLATSAGRGCRAASRPGRGVGSSDRVPVRRTF
jgi:phosphotransferase system enzyme I (PtsI)